MELLAGAGCEGMENSWEPGTAFRPQKHTQGCACWGETLPVLPWGESYGLPPQREVDTVAWLLSCQGNQVAPSQLPVGTCSWSLPPGSSSATWEADSKSASCLLSLYSLVPCCTAASLPGSLSMAQWGTQTAQENEQAPWTTPLLFFAKNISVVSLNSTPWWCTAAQDTLHCRINKCYMSKEKESLHSFTMPLTQNEGWWYHLKCFWFHQEVSLSVLTSIYRVVSIKIEHWSCFPQKAGCKAMNNEAAEVLQDNISFTLFILLSLFFQLNEGITDFIRSAERKSSSLSFVLDAEEFWLFSGQRLLCSTILYFHLPMSSPGKVWPFTLHPNFH